MSELQDMTPTVVLDIFTIEGPAYHTALELFTDLVVTDILSYLDTHDHDSGRGVTV